MTKYLIALVACSIFVAAVNIAHADDHAVTSEKEAKLVVDFRQAILKLVRSNMGPLGAMAKGNIPYDPAVMQTNAMRIEQLATMMEDYFHKDAREYDVTTDAKDKIWNNFDDFKSKAQDMIEASKRVQTVAMQQDEDNYRSAIGNLGSTCKACHDEYKKD